MTIETKQISMDEAIARYYGVLEDADGSSEITGPCGDQMGFSFKLENEQITAIRFKATGCGVTLACGATVAFTVDGMLLSKAMMLSPGYITKLIGNVPPDHRHCPILAATAFYRAIADYFLKTELKAKDNINEQR